MIANPSLKTKFLLTKVPSRMLDVTTTITVRVAFVRLTDEGELHDCLIYPEADFYNANGTRKISDGQLNAAIAVRTNNWRSAVAQAKLDEQARPEPTLDEEFGHLSNPKLIDLKAWLVAKGI